ncbi:MAG: PAS domain S-box protein [Bacteroidota bacterium]
MNQEDKSKTELLRELQQLQSENEALKKRLQSLSGEHNLIEKALNGEDDRFQELFNKAPLGYQSLDFDGNFLEVNQQWLATLGYEYEEVIGRWFGDFLTPVYQDGFRKRFPIFKAQGHIHSEFEMLHKNGSVLFIAFDGRIGYNEQGEFKQTHCILQDITGQKLAEEKLKESESLFRSLFENSPIGKSMTHVDGSLTSNKAFAEMLGYTLDEFQSKNFVDITHPDDIQKSREAMQSLIKGDQNSIRFEKRFLHKDGSTVFADLITALQKDDQGRPSHFITSIIDITQRKQDELKLKESENKIRSIVDSTPFPVAMVDSKDEKIEYWSKSAQDLFGHIPLDVNDWYLAAYPDPEYRQQVIARWKPMIEKARQTGLQVNAGEYNVTCQNGSVRICELYVAFIDNNLVVTFNDITEQKESRKDILKLNRVYILLSNINKTILRTRDNQLIFDEACRIAVTDGGFLMSCIGILKPATQKVDVVASYGKTGDYLKNINIDLNSVTYGSGPTGLAVATGKCFFSNDIETEEKMAPWRNNAMRMGFRSSITLPIMEAGKTMGAFTMYASQPDFFNEAEIKLLDDLASNISFAVEFIESERERNLTLIALEESCNNFQAIFESNSAAMAIIDRDTNISMVNDAYCRMSGYTPKEVVGMSWTQQIPPEDLPRLQEYNKLRLTHPDKAPDKYGFRFYKKDGTVRYGFMSVSMMQHNQKIITSFVDITEQKHAEEALRESEELLSLFVQHSPIYTYIKEVKHDESRVLKASDNFTEIIGMGGKQIIGKTMKELFPPEFATKISKEDWQVVSDGKILKMDENLNDRNYTTIKFPITIGERKLLAGYTIDITEQKNAQQELTHHFNKLSKLNALSLELAMLSVDDNLEAIITQKIKEISGSEISIFSVYNPSDRTLMVKEIDIDSGILEKSVNLLGKQIKKNQTYVPDEMYAQMTKEIIGMRKSLYEVSFGSIPRPVAAGIQALMGVDRFVGISYMVEGVLYGTSLLAFKKGQNLLSREILDNYVNLAALALQRRRAEDALKASEEKYRTIFDNVQDVFYQIDMDGTVTEISPSIKLFSEFKREDILGHSISDLYNDPKDRDAFLDELKRAGELKDYELKLKTKSGVIKHVSVNARLNFDVHGIPHHIDGAIRDVTERKEVEMAKHKQVEDLLHFGKLAVNRENKMIELKKEINGLLESLGKEPKYEIFE